MCPNKEVEMKNKVKSLYEIMHDEKVEELELKSADFKLHIRRKGNNKVQTIVHNQTADTVISSQKVSEDSAARQPAAAGDSIKSPITGVFYRSPSPSSPTFVNEGDVADTGKTLCIVEAMKVMNEIKAEYKMRIVKIVAENGKPVNSGQDLFVIEKL